MKKSIISLVFFLLILLSIRFILYYSFEDFDYTKINKGELECKYRSPYNKEVVYCYYLSNGYDDRYGAITYTVTLVYNDRVVYYGYDGPEFNVEWESANCIKVSFHDPYEDESHVVHINTNNECYDEWDSKYLTAFINKLFVGIFSLAMLLFGVLHIRNSHRDAGHSFRE